MKKKLQSRSGKNSFVPYIFTSVLSFILLLFFSCATSPLYNSFGYDSLEYKLAGSAMLDGLVIYRDIFHQKGASFFFIEAIGEWLCRILQSNRWGTFLVQYVNILLVSALAYKTADMFFYQKNKGRTLYVWCVVLSTMFFWMMFFNNGNLVEEFSMMYQFITLYLAVQYCTVYEKDKENPNPFNPICGIILGICFALTFWAKPTTAVFTGASVLVIGIHMLVNKRFALFWKSAAFGMAGIVIATAPLLLYYYNVGALNDMIEQCFLFNASYLNSENSVDTSILITLKDIVFVYAFPCVTLILAIILHFNLISVLCLVTAAITTVVLLFTTTNYLCYHQIQTPVVFLLLLALSQVKLKKESFKQIAAVGLVACMMISSVALYMRLFLLTDSTQYWQQTTERVDTFKENTKHLFSNDKEPKNVLYVEENDFKISRYFYYSLQKYPFSSMFCLPFFERCNAESYIDAFFEDLENAPPQYIVIGNDREELNPVYAPVIEKAKTEYTVVYADDTYTLYELQ